MLRQAAETSIKDLKAEQVEEAYNKLLEENGGKEAFYKQAGISQEDEEQVKNDIAGRMKAERLTAKLTAEIKEPNEKDIRKYYEKSIERFTIPESVRAAHIVKHPKQDTNIEQMKKDMEKVKLASFPSFIPSFRISIFTILL